MRLSSISIFTTLVIVCIFSTLALSWAPTVSAFPGNTNNVCDVNTPITVHRALNTGAATRLQLSATSIAPGGSVTVTLSGTIRGFVLYAANAAGAHKGVLTNNANSAACETAPAGSDTGSTIRHKNGNTKQNQQFNWKAPTQAGVYTFYALVTEASGSAPVYRLPVASVTVTAPAPVVTQAPPVVTSPPTQPPVVDPPAQPQPEPVATLPPPVIVVITQPPIITDPIDPTDPPANEPDTPIPVTPTTQKPPVTGTTTTTAPPSTGTDRIIPSKGATRPFDAATVALHATPKTDCWTSLNNVVYDISGLFSNHPGGDGTLSGYCGADCSDIFTSVHSTAAADLAKMEANYRIGVLAVISDTPAATQAPVAGPGSGVTPAAQGGGATSTNTKSGMSDSVYIGLIVGGLAVMAILVGGFIYWQKSKHSSTSIAPRV